MISDAIYTIGIKLVKIAKYKVNIEAEIEFPLTATSLARTVMPVRLNRM